MSASLFVRLTAADLAFEIASAERSLCYAAPGILDEPAAALVRLAAQLGPELITVCLDFDDRVLRMGYGTLDAVKRLREVGIEVRSTPGLRTGILVVDDTGFIFTPTALYLEADNRQRNAPNAMRLNPRQAQEAMARLSPAAKMLAVALAKEPAEKERLASQTIEITSDFIADEQVEDMAAGLAAAPPVKFDVARQVRVFTAYLQYVEIKLVGAAIERRRLALPTSLQNLGIDNTIKGRLRTTFELMESDSRSSSELESELLQIRKDYTRSLGPEHGRVILKAVKPAFEEKIEYLRDKLKRHREKLLENLETSLDKSKNLIVEYYIPLVTANPPAAMEGQLLNCGVEQVRCWLMSEVDKVFPRAPTILESMRLEVSYKDMTFETLNLEGFVDLAKNAYPLVDWSKAHEEFNAAAEAP